MNQTILILAIFLKMDLEVPEEEEDQDMNNMCIALNLIHLRIMKRQALQMVKLEEKKLWQNPLMMLK
jgi:hypothetical protein